MVTPHEPLFSTRSRFRWSSELDEAFANLKQATVDASRRGVKVFDPARPTKLYTGHPRTAPGSHLPQKHCRCTEADPKCCETEWRSTLPGVRPLKSSETRYASLEGERLGAAWTLEQTKYPTLSCPNLPPLTDHNLLYGRPGDKAREDITTPRLLKPKERTLLRGIAIVYKPGKPTLRTAQFETP